MRQIGVTEIKTALAETGTDGAPKPVACAWQLPAHSKGKALVVVWTYLAFDTLERRGTLGSGYAYWKIR